MKLTAQLSSHLLSLGLLVVSQAGDVGSLHDHTITRDVAIIGGGSSGTYAAINLKLKGKSVIVIEIESRLGGPVASYTDKVTGIATNYGVQAFYNISLTREYFNYLGVKYANMTAPPTTRFGVDFSDGQNTQAYLPANNFSLWAQQLKKYPTLDYSWDLPSPIPTDLLMPFTKFVEKYNLQDEVYGIFQACSGSSLILQRPTVEVMKIVSGSYLASVMGGAVTTTNRNNSEIYTAAAAKLGTDVLYSSRVANTTRDNCGVTLEVDTPAGRKLIKASKLLISIPPILHNLEPFDLDNDETSLFSRWTYSYYYSMLVNNTGLPTGYSFQNVLAANNTYHTPATPAPFFVSESHIKNYYYVWYTSQEALNQSTVERQVSEVIARLRRTVNSTSQAVPNFVGYRDDTPFAMVPDNTSLADGFYNKIKTVQGKRSTWYTGAAWVSYESPVLWNFTSSIISHITA